MRAYSFLYKCHLIFAFDLSARIFWNLNSQEIHKLTVSKAYNLEMALSLFYYFFSAFTKKLKHNNQEYVLELVDTAGQVNMILCCFWSEFDHDLLDFGKLMVCTVLLSTHCLYCLSSGQSIQA